MITPKFQWGDSPLNFGEQTYKGIVLHLIKRNYEGYQAKRYTLNCTNQNVWIPNKHLQPDGTILPGENLDYIFRRHIGPLTLAGYTGPIPGIKRQSPTPSKEVKSV